MAALQKVEIDNGLESGAVAAGCVVFCSQVSIQLWRKSWRGLVIAVNPGNNL